MGTGAKINFFNEAEQILTELDKSLIYLEQNPGDRPCLEELLQPTSRLKQMAEDARFYQVTAFTHELAMFVGKLKKRKSAVSPISLSVLHRSKIHLYHMIDELKKNQRIHFNHKALISEMRARTVQLKATFQIMRRIAIHTSHILEKNINFVIQGDEIEVSQTAITRISDALAHLIRNAVDHGIESTPIREAGGKAPVGTIRLSAHYEQNCVIIEVQDDGIGIDPFALIEKATHVGVVKPGRTLTENETLRLVFHPGVSTKTVVTEISGRGVGMDVVKTNIEALHGSIDLMTQVGKGTRVCMRLPLAPAGVDELRDPKAA